MFLTITKSPSSICGVNVVLFLPLIIFDIIVANLPTTAFFASISNQKSSIDLFKILSFAGINTIYNHKSN